MFLTDCVSACPAWSSCIIFVLTDLYPFGAKQTNIKEVLLFPANKPLPNAAAAPSNQPGAEETSTVGDVKA